VRNKLNESTKHALNVLEEGLRLKRRFQFDRERLG